MVDVLIPSIVIRRAVENQISDTQLGGGQPVVGNYLSRSFQVGSHGSCSRRPGGDAAQKPGVTAVSAEYQGAAVIIAYAHTSCLAVGRAVHNVISIAARVNRTLRYYFYLEDKAVAVDPDSDIGYPAFFSSDNACVAYRGNRFLPGMIGNLALGGYAGQLNAFCLTRSQERIV